jgi:hypothetical protein
MSFFSNASYSQSVIFNYQELSASATASATSDISKEDAYKIAYNLAKKDVEKNIYNQKIQGANKSFQKEKKTPLKMPNSPQKRNLPINNVSFVTRKKGGCGCGK